MNNRVEQNQRGIKNITKYALGFKSFEAHEFSFFNKKISKEEKTPYAIILKKNLTY